MVEKADLILGLNSEPKYIPFMYMYNDEGARLFNDIERRNEYYYFPKYETCLLEDSVPDIVRLIPKPSRIIDLGCGKAKKCHILFNEYLKQQEHRFTFIPVDISKGILDEVKVDIAKEYGDTIDTKPKDGNIMAFNFIKGLGDIHGSTLFVCFGTLQVFSYNQQLELLQNIRKSLNDDFLLLTLDITRDKETIRKAYMDPTGKEPIISECINRLNREYNARFDMSKFVVEGEFIENENSSIPGAMHKWIQSTCDEDVKIDGLDMKVTFQENDRLYIGENGASFKYTETQLNVMFDQSKLAIVKMWKNDHCALVLLQKA